MRDFAMSARRSVSPTTGNASLPERLLLVRSPAVDTRLPWARWQQPFRILGYATRAIAGGSDVKLIDALVPGESGRLTRLKQQSLWVDDQRVDLWRFGRPLAALASELAGHAAASWRPDEVIVDCFATFWWRGAQEIVDLVRGVFPETPIRVTGAYADLAPEHVREVLRCDPGEPAWAVSCGPVDWSLAATRPALAYISTDQGRRPANEVVEEIVRTARAGVSLFAFAEHGIAGQHPDHFRMVLEGVLTTGSKARFVATGTLAPSELVAHPDLPALMRRAGYRQLFFADDRDRLLAAESDEVLIDEYRRAAELCHAAGFRARTDELAAGVCLGRAGEDLGARTRLITRAAHVIGSVVIWPYQPTPAEVPGQPLEACNGKLFPLRQENGATYRDYLNVQGIGVVLNSKYREYTFDFLGDSLIARLFRGSLARRAWEPQEDVKGPVQLPVLRKRGAA
jgi:hypothetical protein